MQCWILCQDFESKAQKCPVLRDERWVRDWNFPSACTWVYWKGSHDVTQKAVTYLALVSQNRALLTFWLKVFVQNLTLHGFVYTKAVKESEEISCFSLQSWKRSFRKIQIFKFAYCAGRCFIPCLGWNHLCMEWYIRNALKNRKRLVASRYSLRSARFAKYRFLNLHILHFRCFIPCLGWNHLCMEWYIRKALKNQKRLVASRYSLRSARFAKCRFLNLHILHFRCFIPCLGPGLGYVHFSTWLFISFRFVSFHFVSQNTVSLLQV